MWRTSLGYDLRVPAGDVPVHFVDASTDTSSANHHSVAFKLYLKRRGQQV